jgi:hypothetical protein
MPSAWMLRLPSGDTEFTDDSGIFFRSFPEIGTPDSVTEDRTYPYGDGTVMGVDRNGGTTLSMEFGIEGATEGEARDRYQLLRSLWRGDDVRGQFGAVAELRSDRGRSALGRPRRIAPSEWRLNHTPPGLDVVADFQTIDDLWYGPQEFLTVPLAVSQGGGLVSRQYAPGNNFGVIETAPQSGFFMVGQLEETQAGLYSAQKLTEIAPGSGLYTSDAGRLLFDGLKSPLVARGYTSRANTFAVTGEVPTWPVITIHGQILNPTVEVAGAFKFSAGVSLAFDETITIDTRPGIRSVLRNGTRIASLTRTSSLLDSAALPPGAHTLTLSGSASIGTPSATIAWRAAYSTP